MARAKSPSTGNADGFTLIEILVALAILAFVALGIAGLFTHSIRTNASGHDYALLATEARIALESLQALPFDDPDLSEAGSPHTMAPVNPNFTITYTVEDSEVTNWEQLSASPWPTPTPATGTNLKRITMTVASTTQVLEGRRIFTVSTLKIPG
jgi:prepilin-type N-terminal cleavage/methylation domain-containing protein